MKDYKLSELKAICKDNDCDTCPIDDFCDGDLSNSRPKYWDIDEAEEIKMLSEMEVKLCVMDKEVNQ